jgi:hypothetical protein
MWPLVVFVSLLILGPYFAAIPLILIPMYWDEGRETAFWIHFSFATAIIILLETVYLKCWLTNPGEVPKGWVS